MSIGLIYLESSAVEGRAPIEQDIETIRRLLHHC
jgi:hypothetical protein